MNIDPRVDHYKILGVSSDASAGDIKKAYRNLAKKFHPDSTGGDKAKETRFKEVSQAYDVLGDKDKRAQYDAMRSRTSRFAGGIPGGFPGGVGGEADLGELFAQMFRGTGGPGGNVKVRYTQSGGRGRAGGMPFGGEAESFTDEAGFGGAFGGRRPQRPPPQTERQVRMSDGSGGRMRGADIHSDVRLSVDKAILGTVVDVPTLEGRVKLKIPPGTGSGKKLRLKGRGATTTHGSRGDHYVTVHIDVPQKIDETGKKLLIQFMQHVQHRNKK
jgi:molecular chaperone DnaJ